MKILNHTLMAALPLTIVLFILQIISLTTAWITALIIILALLAIHIIGLVMLFRAYDEDEPL